MSGTPKKLIQISFADLCGIITPAPPPAGNLAPVISSGFSPARVNEIADKGAGENSAYHTRIATLKFSDSNVSDVHSASFVPLGGGYRGTFSLGTIDQTANCVKWTFKVRDDKLDHLQKGQTLTQNYKITISDGHGGTTSKIVTVVLVGTNDAPVITSGVQKATITELGGCDEREINFEHSGTGAVTFSDADSLDTHTRTFAPQSAGYIGNFALGAVNQSANSINWTFTVDDSALESLSEGETLVQRYNVTVNDGHGGTAMQTVTVCIVGTNDKPVITVDQGNPYGTNDLVYEEALPAGTNDTSNGEFAGGTFKLSDPDGLDDLVSVTINGTTVLIADLVLGPVSFPGTYGILTVTAYDAGTGVATYIYELTTPYSTNPAADDGNNVEPDADYFQLTVSDGTTNSAAATILIDIVDDVPEAGYNPVIRVCSPEDDNDDDDDDHYHDYDGGNNDEVYPEANTLTNYSETQGYGDNDDEDDNDDDDDHSSGLAIVSGTLAHNFGADQAGSIALAGIDLPIAGGFTQNGSGALITVQQNGVDVFLVELTDPVTGSYQITQLAPLCHDDDDDEEEDENEDYEGSEYQGSETQSHSLSGANESDGYEDSNDADEVIFTLHYTVTDADGDMAFGSAVIAICCSHEDDDGEDEEEDESSDYSDGYDNSSSYAATDSILIPIQAAEDPLQHCVAEQQSVIASLFGDALPAAGTLPEQSLCLPAYATQNLETEVFT